MVRLYLKTIDNIARYLIIFRIGPMAITTLGMLLSLAAGVLIFLGHLITGGIMVFVAGILDNLDGAVARMSKKVTRYGALFDSTLDRYSEFFVFAGIWGYIQSYEPPFDWIFSIVLLFAMMGSFMVSYVRARSEALKIGTQVGIFQRPVRVIALGLSTLLAGIFTTQIWYKEDIVMRLFLVILAIGPNITAIRRLRDSHTHWHKQNLEGLP